MKKNYVVVSSTGVIRAFEGTQNEYFQHMINTEEGHSSESYSFTALCPTKEEAIKLADNKQFAYVV